MLPIMLPTRAYVCTTRERDQRMRAVSFLGYAKTLNKDQGLR